jgi:hypothetical protein
MTTETRSDEDIGGDLIFEVFKAVQYLTVGMRLLIKASPATVGAAAAAQAVESAATCCENIRKFAEEGAA